MPGQFFQIQGKGPYKTAFFLTDNINVMIIRISST